MHVVNIKPLKVNLDVRTVQPVPTSLQKAAQVIVSLVSLGKYRDKALLSAVHANHLLTFSPSLDRLHVWPVPRMQ